MKQYRRLLCMLLSVALMSFSQAQLVKTDLPPGFDAYITKVLKTFEVPGMSIAIVKDGKALMAKGYGIKKLGDTSAVNAHTLFAIASNSKAFTATALALLVEEGKLKWDDHVVDYLPSFRMSDSYITAHLTIRDLLVHHSGIPAYAGDLMLFPPSTYSRKEIIRRIRYIPFVNEFRNVYAYDNILYLVAGEIISTVSGMEWEDFVKTKIFDKLGMAGSITRFSTFKSQSDIAAAHFRSNGKIKEIPLVYEQAIGDAGNPAGGIASNATDMAKWLITQLDSGRTMDKQVLFKPSTTNELWKIVRPMPIAKAPETIKPSQMNFYGYGLGFRSFNYGKYKVVIHGGKLDGFVSQIAMVPELKLGIVVLTNQESTGAYWSVIYQALDHYMHNPSFDWVGGYKKLSDTGQVRLAEAQKKAVIKRDTAAAPSLPLEKYTGNFRDELCGDVTIAKKGNNMTLHFDFNPQLVADLTHFHHDTFIANFRNKDFKANAYITFAFNPDLSIDQVKMNIIDPDADLSFSALLLKPVKQNEKQPN